MQYSGILVVLRPEAWAEGLERIAALADVEVHHAEESGHRVVVVVETPGLAGQEAALRHIREVPGVVVAEPVYHYLPDAEGGPGEDSGPGEGPTG